LQFRLGRCLLAAGSSREAQDAFVLARDYDTLRFRADSICNDYLRELAESHSGVELVDAEK
jgi:hypothetical protein